MNKKLSQLFGSVAFTLMAHTPAVAATSTNAGPDTGASHSYSHGHVNTPSSQERAPAMEDIINIEKAFKAKDQATVQKIITGLDINKPLDGRSEQTTILEYAVYGNNVSLAKLSLDHGADANGVRPKGYGKSSRTPLMDATSSQMVELLTQHKADLDAQDTETVIGQNKGNTALHYSAIRQNEGIKGAAQVTKALILAGANPLITNQNGLNAFRVADCNALQDLSDSPKTPIGAKLRSFACPVIP